MMKSFAFVFLFCVADAANIRIHDDNDIAREADEEVQGMQDVSNKALWQEAWGQTLSKHDASDALMNDQLKEALYPEAQMLFNNLLQARHRLKQKMSALQEQQQQQDEEANKGKQADSEAFESAKAGFLERMTAGIKDIRDDDPPATTTTTTTENAEVVKERLAMAALKDSELQKMTAGVAEAKDDAPSTTTTTVDPAAQAEKEHFDQLKQAEMSKLTSGLDEKSIDAAEKTATTTTTSTTTTVTLGEAGKKIMAEISTGKFVLPSNFAGIQQPQQTAPVDDQHDDASMSETMEDLDTYGF
jgi:hypothetical protein